MEEAVYFSPGRVNLIGEHTDYNGGLVLPAAVQLGNRFTVRAIDARVVRIESTQFNESVELSLDSPRATPVGHWSDYFAGVLAAIDSTAGSGLAVRVDSTLPAGSGLSSSASITTGFATVLSDFWELGLSSLEIARTGQRAENDFVGLQCGILDQFAIVMGERGKVMKLDCSSLRYETATFPENEFRILLADTGVSRSLASSGYNQRRAECERALAYLRSDYALENLSGLSLEQLEGSALSEDDPVAFRRALHIVGENLRVESAFHALLNGDRRTLGDALYASHDSMSRNYEASCPELDAMKELASGIDGVVGAKMTGAGFGGACVVIVDADAAGMVSAALSKAYSARTGLKPTLLACQAGDGIRRIQ